VGVSIEAWVLENACDGRVDVDSLFAFLNDVDFCSITDCKKLVKARNYCSAHYARWLKYGDPLICKSPQRPRGLSEAEVFAWFMPGGPPSTDCWDWQGGTNKGYGEFILNGVHVGAHAASHRIYNGPTNGLGVLHSCDRPICVQPLHLGLGSQRLNMSHATLRGRIARGEKSGTSKLTEVDVLWVRAQFRKEMTYQEMADVVGVSRSTIKKIRLRETWAHL
jgi:hypothetical protein